MPKACKGSLAVFGIVLAVLLTSFYYRYLVGESSFYFFDIDQGFQPIAQYIGERLRQGSLPLWNPYALGGVSQVAFLVMSVFYPLHALFILPFNCGYALLLLIQQLVAGLGMFLLVRSFGWNTWAAAFGGFACALNGLMFSAQVAPSLVGPAVWFILAWWALRRIDQGELADKLLSTAVAAVAGFLLLTAGAAEIFAPAFLFLFGVTLVSFLADAASSKRRAVAILCLRWLALGLGVLLAMCELLPAFEWFKLSPRYGGLPAEVVFAWSATWYDLFGVAAFQPLGDLFDSTNKFQQIMATPLLRTPFLENQFLGPSVITLAFWGAGDRRWKYGGWLVALLLIWLLIAASGSIPQVMQLANWLNLHLFRYPIKAMVFVTLVLILLAARGMHVFMEGLPSRGNTFACLFWTAWLLAALLLLGPGSNPAVLSAGNLHLAWRELFVPFGRSALLSAALGLLYVLIYSNRVLFSKPVAAGFILVSCLACLMADAFWFNRHEGPSDFYQKPSLVATKIKELSQKQGALWRSAILYEMPAIAPSMSAGSNHLLRLAQSTYQFMPPMLNLDFHIDNVTRGNVEETADHNVIWQTALTLHEDNHQDLPLATACKMSSAPLMISQLGKFDGKTGTVTDYRRLDESLFLPLYIDPTINLGIYRVQGVLPRAYFAHQVKWGKPHDAVLRFVERPDLSSFDPGKMTIIEHQSAREIGPQINITDTEWASAHASFVVDQPERVKLDVYTPKDNFLVLNDRFYPGWQAEVDGQPAAIYQTNVLFRSVLVRAGHHNVEFFYRPVVLQIGLALHALAWLVIALLVGLAFTANRLRRRLD